jgi:hypothetical protein
LVVYWLLFAYFATGALMRGNQALAPDRRPTPMLALGALVIALLVGFRYEVGGDWQNYEFLFSYARFADLGRVLLIGDPGYQLLNWSVQRLGAGIWLVNLVCGLIFAWGLLRLAKAQPDPWLAFLVAIPYLVVVVALGYSRQAVAIGILMAGMGALERGASVLRFTAYVAVAALFHKTAVVVLPLVIFAGQRSKFLNAAVGIAAFIILWDLFLADSVDQFVSNYIEAEYSAQGAAIRVAMNLVPATLFLLGSRRFGFPEQEEKMWRYFSLAAFAFLAMLLVLPSSAAVDRLALYIMPLQVAVLSRLPAAYASPGPVRLMVVLYSFTVLFVWLNFAVHAQYWVPYQFYPIF